MQGTTYDGLSFQQVTSTGTNDPKSLTVPAATRALFISVETTDARMTFAGVAPDSTHGHVIKKDVQPFILPLGGGSGTVVPNVQFASTAAAVCIVNVTYLS